MQMQEEQGKFDERMVGKDYNLVGCSGPKYGNRIGKLGHLNDIKAHLNNIKTKPKHVEEENTCKFSNASFSSASIFQPAA